MDGLGYVGVLGRLIIPVAVPAIATVTVLQFIQIWDDLLVGLLFLQNPQRATDHGRVSRCSPPGARRRYPS